jgi:hypothetical protein
LIVVYTRSGAPLHVKDGASVAATTLPTVPGNTPASALAILAANGATLAVVRVSEIAGYDLSRAGNDA